MANTVAQFLCYQHNLQQSFIRHADKYFGIIIPFSIASTFPGGTYGFVRALLAKNPEKQFLLDPRSALFQKSWNRVHVRDPHVRVAQVFGPPISDIGLQQAITAQEMVMHCEGLTRSTIEYQVKFRTMEIEDQRRKIEKYRKLLGLESVPEINSPQLFIPPYFEFQQDGDEWYAINLRCIRIAAAEFKDLPLRPILHFQSWKKIANWNQVNAELSALGISSAFIYPNDFKEHDADSTELRAYRMAVEQFASSGRTPFALHGGYFSILMHKFGLGGFGNGVGYGEWRNSNYHKGGTAEIRVYIPRLHRFLDAASAQSLVSADADYFTSDSDLLAEYAATSRPLTEMSLGEAQDVSMEARLWEMEQVSSLPIESLAEELKETTDRLKEIGPLEYEQYAHSLQRWRSVLVGE